ncbi:MAG: OmpA family protein, partial [Candidatus Solibacter sp.]|nr:OmpA family protein [Candidatus Solibacter sp.]
SRQGDLISGRVVTPAHLAGDLVEGRITESRSGAKLGGQSAFSFTFDTLRHGGAAIPISSQFRSAVNSKGKANVDEEGRIVKRATGNVGKAAGGTGAGALLGGLAGGKKGAAIGAAVGAGASIAVIQIAADAPNIRFSPGSRVMIEAAGRDGSPLPTATAANAAVNPAPLPASAPVAIYAPAPAAAAPVQVAAAPAAAAAPAPAAAPAQAAPASSPQPEMTTLKSAFIPGEKTIFFDDFSDMSAGDAPPHFKIRGGAPELRAAGAVRQLTATSRGSMFPNLTSLPKNFTYEAEIKVDASRRAIVFLVLTAKAKEYFHLGMYADAAQMDIVASMRAPFAELGRKRIPMSWNEPVKFALWVQNGRMRVFINGEKHLDFNQVDLPEIDSVEFRNDIYTGASVGYRSVRFAESTPDFSQVIGSSGRFVTHGILFDTGSDRLKAESAPVIQSIAKGLETNPNLKLQIEGHTDSVGNAAANLDLSKRRAEAVKAVLVTQFKVDEARLTTAGMGATKPMDSNDTPQGRAQNRRVELVKQ